MTTATVLEEVRAAYGIELCLLPVAADGSKRPDVKTWDEFKRRRPTREQMQAFAFSQRSGYGVVSGAVSGHRESWDFDELDTYRAFLAAADTCGLGDVVRRIDAGYCDETPAGGRRWIVQYPPSVDWRDVTLARRPGRDGEPKIKTLIELPTFAILAPSYGPVHPSGRPYVRLAGGFDTIASYTADERADLIALARSFDAMPRPVESTRQAVTPADSDRPGDAFNRQATWPEILEPAGWRHVYTSSDVSRWCRPGKAHGVSATTNIGGSDLLYVFSSSTSFEPERSYTKFAAYATLQHAGDFGAAARALRTQGYGAAGTRTATSLDALPPSTSPPSDDRRRVATPVLHRLADVHAEDVKFLWAKRIARGKLGLLVGDPGLGKSTITLDVASRVSRGASWPDGGSASQHDVILLSAEDGLADTIRPRLDAMGADVERIHALTAVRLPNGDERCVSLATDIQAIDAAIDQTAAGLVIVDPLSAYLGKTDSYKDGEVRSVLMPLADLAQRRGVAIVGVMHLGKGEKRSALYRALGSIAFVAAARIVLAVAPHPDDDEKRVLAWVKGNIAGPAETLAYSLAGGRLAWDADPVVGVDVDALLSAPGDRQERREADAWLRGMLADGPILSKEIERAADQAGIARRTLFRSKARLSVEAERIGFGPAGKWYWRLTSPTDESSKSAIHEKVAPFDKPPINSHRVPLQPPVAPYERVAPFEEGPRPGRDEVWEQADARFRAGWQA